MLQCQIEAGQFLIRNPPDRVAVLVDVSGGCLSWRDEALRLADIICRLSKEAWVIEFDTETRSVHKYGDGVVHPLSPDVGGGTDLGPPLADADRLGVERIVVITDGCLTPPEPARPDVIFLLTPDGLKVTGHTNFMTVRVPDLVQ